MQKDGQPLRVHLEAAARHSAFARQELVGPEIPPALAYVAGWFWELHVARSYAANGPNPISYQDIAAWARLTRTRVRPWEVEVLRTMDMTWMAGPPKRDHAGQRTP